MSSDVSVQVRNLSKCYNIYSRPHDRFMQAAAPRVGTALKLLSAGNLGSRLQQRRYFREFWALRDVTFDIRKGETVGIVGRNGSGKSTLLQLIAGTLTPTLGEAVAYGRVAALLELGSGFNPDFSGLENVFLNGALLGFSRKEMEERLDKILEFADIGDFVNRPVKTYSSGMLVRLAFAVQAQVQPQILIVDEALAVGDAKFQARCFARLKELKESGTSILFVSHSTEQIVTQCDRAFLLDEGRLVDSGKPNSVVNNYLNLLFGGQRLVKAEKKDAEHPPIVSETEDATLAKISEDTLATEIGEDHFSKRPNYNKYEYRWGDRAAEIMDFSLTAGSKCFPQIVDSGSELKLGLSIFFKRKVSQPIIGVTVKSKDGVLVYLTNSELVPSPSISSIGSGNTVAKVMIEFRCALGSGDYFISVGVASRDGGDVIPHDRRYDSIHLHVVAERFHGFSDLGLALSAQTVPAQALID